MLEVTFYRDDDGRFAGFCAYGHTDFAEHGEDIVCAAVSAVLQAAALGLAECAQARVESKQASGDLECTLHEEDRGRESVAAIVSTAELAIAQIARRFPKHVHLKGARLQRSVGDPTSQRVSL
ncbi:MAG: ribosomal-processing cysteine protease Prp [Candidatus Eremiobacteraeota bacterium]|nr:ribosomal-processing cysteine protease Prp [Candidatus Eremiobacteraeota bacterium]